MSTATRHKRIGTKRTGEILVDRGVLSEAELEQALAHQKKSGGRLGQVITELGLGSPSETERELAWISANRHLYANRWIALHGDTLLAVGDTAREVYRATAGYPGVPLVIQVEPLEGTNFAGW